MSKYTIIQNDDALIVNGEGEPVDLWNDLRRHFLAHRAAYRGAGGLRYPETTNSDALAVVAVFDRELAQAPLEVSGLATETKIWRRASKRITSIADGPADDTFADNEGLWLRDVKRLAVYLTVARHLPTRTELLDDLADFARMQPGRGAVAP